MELVKLIDVASDKNIDLKCLLEKCIERKIPTLYRIPQINQVHYGKIKKIGDTSANESTLYNLNIIAAGKLDFLLLLENRHIENLIKFGEDEIISAFELNYINKNQIEDLDGYDEIENYKINLPNKFRYHTNESKYKFNKSYQKINKCLIQLNKLNLLNELNKNSTDPYSKKLVPIAFYHFLRNSSEVICFDNTPNPIKLRKEEVFIEKKHIDAIIASLEVIIPEDSPYFIGSDYSNYETLRKLAEIGFRIFEANKDHPEKIDVPRTAKDGAELLKKHGISYNKKELEAAYFLININISKNAKVKCPETPQIQHLIKIPSNLTLREKETEVTELFKNPEKVQHIVKLITLT